MQIFELHFNPKLKEGQIFDSFIYEPENVYEKKLGSLYIVGELQNVLPQNSKFLDELAGVVKKNHYTLSAKSPEKSLSQCLKKTNEFLSEEVKKENVSWLGNLNFAVLSLSNFNLTFTKTGQLKILLLRNGQIIDIGKNLELQEIDPYPLKIFFNVVSGKLTQNDVILVLTKQVFDFLKQRDILAKLARQTSDLNPQKLKEILPSTLFSQGEGKNVSGICLLVDLRPGEKRPRLRQSFGRQAILFQTEKKISLLNLLKLPKISLPKLPKMPKIKLPRFKIQPFKIQLLAIIKKFRPQRKIRKKIILFLVLISLLILGFLIF